MNFFIKNPNQRKNLKKWGGGGGGRLEFMRFIEKLIQIKTKKIFFFWFFFLGGGGGD